MRSERYATRYRVGSLPAGDVYWQPGVGYTVERSPDYLSPITDLSDVEWFDREGDLRRIVEDVGISNGKLLEAMDRDMNKHLVNTLANCGLVKIGLYAG